MTLGAVLVDSTIKLSLLMLCALAVVGLLRKRSAALRHWVLAAALMCAAATPLLQVIVPAWDLRPSTEPVAVLATLSDNAAPVRPAVAAPVRTMTTARILGSAWGLGFGISLGLLLVGLARLAWVSSRAQPVIDGPWKSMAHEMARRYGIRRRLVLLQSDHPTLLVTWGLVVPKVMLPAAARQWSDDRARIVVSHEFAHIQRGDWIVHIAAALVRAVYWFNPLVWIACERLRRESELACDDAVLNLGIDRTKYATELVDLTRTFSAYGRTAFSTSPAPAMARPSSLERRIRAMLNVQLNRRPVTRAAAVAIVVALLGLALPLAGLGAQSGPASFSGSLLDTIGRILPDVPMTITNVDTAAKHQGRSDANGHFVFSGLPAGDYEIDAQMPGFASRYRVTLKAGQNVQQAVTLQLGTIEETITLVKSSAPRAPAPVRDLPPLHAREPAACDQSPTGGCIEQPTKIRDMKPRYPDNRNEDVTIVLQARIGTDGRVKWAEGRTISPAEREFAQAAIDAVNQWRFTPTYLDGVPVEVDMKVTVNFRVEW